MQGENWKSETSANIGKLQRHFQALELGVAYFSNDWKRRAKKIATFAPRPLSAYADTMRRIFFIALASLAISSRASVDVRLDGELLWMSADKATLREVMQAFAHAGVSVRYDDGISATCSGVLTNADAGKSLADLFGPFGYVITWDVVRGPIGDITRLAEIQVFRTGNKDAAKPLVDNNKLPVTRLPGHPPFVSDEILVGFKPGTKMDQVRAMLAKVGGTIVSSIPKLGIYRIRLPPGANVLSLVDMLKTDGVVADVEPNYVTQLPRGTGIADANSPALRNLGSPAKGAATVAILDSGQLSGNGYDAGVVGKYNAIQPGAPMTDAVGHGTQMSMLVAGSVSPTGATGDGTGEVPVLAVRAFDDSGLTSNYALMDAINYAGDQGAKVVNLSWGSDTSSDFVSAAISKAQTDGMIVVAAAGNEPTGNPVYPSAYPGVVSVAALNADGTPWQSSNYGSTVTVAAPGFANFPVGHDGPPGDYAGTSIASAYVSRALAEYMTQNPSATAAQTVSALKTSVTPVGTGSNPHYGFGALDTAAMQRLLGNK